MGVLIQWEPANATYQGLSSLRELAVKHLLAHHRAFPPHPYQGAEGMQMTLILTHDSIAIEI